MLGPPINLLISTIIQNVTSANFPFLWTITFDIMTIMI